MQRIRTYSQTLDMSRLLYAVFQSTISLTTFSIKAATKVEQIYSNTIKTVRQRGHGSCNLVMMSQYFSMTAIVHRNVDVNALRESHSKHFDLKCV